jgi:ferritin-like metal-binding protein YciE
MKINDLRSLYLAELQEARSFELLIGDAVGDLAAMAADPDLRRTLADDVAETQRHAARLARMIARRGGDADAHEDRSMRTLIDEARRWAAKIDDPAVRDAAMIASAQRMQHYEIAVYGSLVAWATQLGLPEKDDLIAILTEEKMADARLSELALRSVNPRALD